MRNVILLIILLSSNSIFCGVLPNQTSELQQWKERVSEKVLLDIVTSLTFFMERPERTQKHLTVELLDAALLCKYLHGASSFCTNTVDRLMKKVIEQEKLEKAQEFLSRVVSEAESLDDKSLAELGKWAEKQRISRTYTVGFKSKTIKTKVEVPASIADCPNPKMYCPVPIKKGTKYQ